MQFSQISSWRRWFEVILRHIKYITLCHVSDPNFGGGGGADCFHPKWAVDSSYSWNVHCFQIRWRICHFVGIGIKGSSRNWVNAAVNPLSIVTGWSQWQKQCWANSPGNSVSMIPSSTEQQGNCDLFPLLPKVNQWESLLSGMYLLHTHSEKSPTRPMLFYSTNYWHQFWVQFVV